MTAEQAKTHLTRQDGEPTTGYVSAWDVGNSVDQIYTDMDLIVPPDAGTLDSLTDVEAANPSAGDVLEWSGTAWHPAAPMVVGDPFQVPEASGGDDTSVIQDALDAAAVVVGSTTAVAVVRLWPGQVYSTSDTLVLPSQVVLDGAGSVIRLSDASNCDVVESVDFATLTGSNLWYVDDGVPSSFGLVNLVIDGNKAGQDTGGVAADLRRRRGASLYGKYFLIHNVVIDNCRGSGLYSEGAYYAGGQDTFRDCPEAEFYRLRTQYCDGHGVHFRGPHDAHFASLYTNGNGMNGYRSESVSQPAGTPGGYNGSADITFLHSFYNTAAGVYLGSMSSVGEMSTESNRAEGLVVEAWAKVRVHGLMCYRNWLPADPNNPPVINHGYPTVSIAGGPHTFGSMLIETQFGGTGVRVIPGTGTPAERGIIIGVLSVDGNDTNARGLSIGADHVTVGSAVIQNCNATPAAPNPSGVGVQIDDALENVVVNATTMDCKTHLVLPANGTGNRMRLNVNGYVPASQVGMTGTLTGRGNELNRHFGGAGTGLYHESARLHWSAGPTLAHDGTHYYVSVAIPSWASSVSTSRMIIAATVGANGGTGLSVGQTLPVESINTTAHTAKILWTHPFGAEPSGCSIGLSVAVNYTITIMDQDEA